MLNGTIILPVAGLSQIVGNHPPFNEYLPFTCDFFTGGSITKA